MLLVFPNEPIVGLQEHYLLFRRLFILTHRHQFLIRNFQSSKLLCQTFDLCVFFCDLFIECLNPFLLDSILILKLWDHGDEPLILNHHLLHLILEPLVLFMQFRVLLVHEFSNRQDLFYVAVFCAIFLVLVCLTYLIHLKHQIVDFLLLLHLHRFGRSISAFVNITLEPIIIIYI